MTKNLVHVSPSPVHVHVWKNCNVRLTLKFPPIFYFFWIACRQYCYQYDLRFQRQNRGSEFGNVRSLLSHMHACLVYMWHCVYCTVLCDVCAYQFTLRVRINVCYSGMYVKPLTCMYACMYAHTYAWLYLCYAGCKIRRPPKSIFILKKNTLNRMLNIRNRLWISEIDF